MKSASIFELLFKSRWIEKENTKGLEFHLNVFFYYSFKFVLNSFKRSLFGTSVPGLWSCYLKVILHE
jgi:hypothetical protein